MRATGEHLRLANDARLFSALPLRILRRPRSSLLPRQCVPRRRLLRSGPSLDGRIPVHLSLARFELRILRLDGHLRPANELVRRLRRPRAVLLRRRIPSERLVLGPGDELFRAGRRVHDLRRLRQVGPEVLSDPRERRLQARALGHVRRAAALRVPGLRRVRLRRPSVSTGAPPLRRRRRPIGREGNPSRDRSRW
jgi:hypothetical protein